MEVVNPATEEVIAEVASAEQADVDAAVAAARAALDGPWGKMSARERGRLVRQLGERLMERADEVARLETLHNGKPISESRHIEIPAAAECFEYYAGWADKVMGETIPVKGNYLTYTLREPIGVVAAIVPWNFPLLLAAWKVAPALACGNTVILKPASQTPLTALALGEIALEVGLPPGVLNVITGPGSTVGQALVEHPGIDKIAFTGDTSDRQGDHARRGRDAEDDHARARRQVAEHRARRRRPRRGGPRRDDRHLLRQGRGLRRRLAAARRRVDQGRVHRQARRAGEEDGARRSARSEDAVRRRSRRRSSSRPSCATSSRARAEGATLVAGGARADIGTGKGYFVQPTVFADVTPEMTIAREEIFGPVLAAIEFADVDEAIADANDSPYGLAAGVWTRDIKKAHYVARKLQAGTVWVNTYNVYDTAAPFGGYKQSGFGREMSAHALEHYTQVKSVWVDLS